MQPFCGELKEGMEIKSNDISNYKGIVLEVRYEYGKQVQAYIAREDKRTGGGKVFPEYGPSWQIRRTWNNQWG
ncbi:hypothetical protein, partial [Oceanihabitans sediminis]|uniref:hypothetical protein n=1 Tax=Oceanihabitans sediminis TaxID=1812012 RepID=UPI00299E20B2